MEKLIINKLHEIEAEENIKILLAVESGSRAWGFSSPDSDYDVRFIYVRKKNEYLRLEKIRDVIEKPISDELDINGWDLQKALRLLYKSNPTLFEWFSSPIVYIETEFADRFRSIMKKYFTTKRSLFHYIHMAEGNYREYLRGEFVKAKKYFYVLRPVLACQWILDKATPPPILFSELMKAELPCDLMRDVNYLLDIKINSPELREIHRVDAVNEYLDYKLSQVKTVLQSMEETQNVEWNELDDLFLWTLKMEVKRNE